MEYKYNPEKLEFPQYAADPKVRESAKLGFVGFLTACALGLIICLVVSALLNSTRSEAMTDGESRAMFKLFQRVLNVEKQERVRVPDHLKFYINCTAEEQLKESPNCDRY